MADAERSTGYNGIVVPSPPPLSENGRLPTLGLVIPPPPPAKPKCVGGPCISEQRARPLEDLADIASGRCNTCGADVCFLCGSTPVDHHFSICDSCGEEVDGFLEGVPPDTFTGGVSRWDLRSDLNRLAGQIVHASGLTYPTVQAQINKSMGIWRRDQADPDQLQHGIDAAEAWLARCTQQATDSRSRLCAELATWAAERGLTLAEVAALASTDEPAGHRG